MALRVFLAALLLFVSGASHAQAPAEKSGFSPRLVIYLAKGADNSCGPGCNSWIAVEGEIDQGAAARVRRFLRGVKDLKRPIYFHSPGGAVEQSFAIARLLRSRKAIAHVGKTIVTACAAGTQIDAACLKIKEAGGEVTADLVTRNAMCNSACTYMFLGAATREAAPDALIAVHNSKFTVTFHGHPTARQVEEVRERGIARADRDREAFIAGMGITRDLNDLIKTVKFENFHVLTRAELYRFGVDTRPFIETAWSLQKAARPYVHKVALAKIGNGPTFQMMEWRLFCDSKDRARMMYVQEFDPAAAAVNSVVMEAPPEKSLAFAKSPGRVGKYQVWNDVIAPDVMTAMLAAPRLNVAEATSESDNKPVPFTIDTDGLQQGWSDLLASCAAPSEALPVVASPAVPATPAP